MLDKITKDVVIRIKDLKDKGVSLAELRRQFRLLTGYKKTQGNQKFKELMGQLDSEIIEEHGLEFLSSKYCYNKTTDQYICNLKCQVKPLILSGAKHRSIHRSYSSYGEDLTISEICRKYQLTPEIFGEYKRIFGLEKSKEPLTTEEILENDVETSVEIILENKRFSIYQEFEKESWKEISGDAAKWREFRAKIVDPFVRFLENWNPPDYIPYKPIAEKRGYSMIVALNDIHIGNYANEKYLLRGRRQTTEETVKDIQKYYESIIQDIATLKLSIESLTILSLGDILHTATPYGTTTKGTPLRFDVLDEELFEISFNSLANFVYQLSKIAPKTNLISLRGNHSGVLENNLFFALSKYFHKQENIIFDICKTDITTFRVKGLMCVAGHGASNSLKIKAPTGLKLQNQIQSYIISESYKYPDIVARAAFFADLHQSMMYQFNDFDYILFPTMVKGDQYADALGYKQQAKQQVLLVDDEGIKGILNYKF